VEARADGLVDVVLGISAIPYGRNAERSARAVRTEGRGTCSTKHLLLADVVEARWPELTPMLWHRVYCVTPGLAAARWGPRILEAVPAEGLVDVHTYATLTIGGRAVTVDVTFPIAQWDGVSDLELACGPGDDHPAGPDPLASKDALVAQHCDPGAREPFIAALSTVA
jgi:hypothetical protein